MPGLSLKIQPLYKLPITIVHDETRVNAVLKFYDSSVLLDFPSKCQQHNPI